LPPQPIEIPKLPENPVYETNRRISEATTYIEDIRSVVEEAARLLKSMNDLSLNLLATFTSSARQTGRHNSILIGIAIVTLIVSAWISYLNYRDTGRDVAGARAVLSTLVDVSSTSGGRIAERLASVSKLLESSLSESGLRLNANNQAIGVSNAELERIRLELEGIRSDNVRVLKELNAVMRESNGAVNK